MNKIYANTINTFFNKIIKNASLGEMEIYEFIYNISFNTTISKNGKKIIKYKNTEKEMPTLYINDVKSFSKILLEYANEIIKSEIRFTSSFDNSPDEKRIEAVLSFIWSNATYSDLENPIPFLKRFLSFIKDDTFKGKKYKITNIESLKNYDIVINNYESPGFLETPYYFNIELVKDDISYKLPKVMYGIENDTAYIYAIQNEKNANTNENLKEIKRALYKLNKNVFLAESDEYQNKTEDYYPENISDISPSALLSLSIATSLFQSKNIHKIKAPDFLPIRFFAKEKLIRKKINRQYKDNPKKEEILENFLDMQMNTQKNITDKFIRTFRRLEHHFENINITSLPPDSSFIEIVNNGNIICNNEILEEISKKIINNKSKNK